MKSVGRKDTAPELAVRRYLHSRGLRYCLHVHDLPGTPDIVLPRYRTAIYVHGCFWHGHDCKHGSVQARTNREFWQSKIETNRERDVRKATALRQLGWSHPYNLSLFGAVTEHLGDAKAEEWLKGVVSNLARAPKGGDTDQIKAVAAGECDIAVTNSYYLARLLRSTKPEDTAVISKVGVVFPNQQSWGTHMNIAGGAVARHAKNQENAVKFLEYLASASAQNYFANGNNEWPAAKGVAVDNPALKSMTGGAPFKSETIPISAVGANTVKVQQMLDRVGFK